MTYYTGSLLGKRVLRPEPDNSSGVDNSKEKHPIKHNDVKDDYDDDSDCIDEWMKTRHGMGA